MANELERMVLEKAQTWLDGHYDDETKKQVKYLMENDMKELVESFYKDLEFGTGGLRGIMGVGSNRMNIYTVGAATQGLANYLKKNFAGEAIRVAVGHDSRNNSRLFAERVADIFASNGFAVYLFDALRPTPELSFAIRELKCQSGVVVTASHNPKEYNGYKAYWSDGAQMISPHDVKTIEYVNQIKSNDQIKWAPDKDLIQSIGKDIDEQFLADIHTLSLDPEADKRHKDMKIVYTPIHGTGVKMIPDSLRNYGFTNIIHVPEQDVPSGDFPTVESPNPENPSAMAMAIAKAKEVNADLVVASDPDADRIGAVVRDKNGNYQLINGNQIVMILLNYIMLRNRELGRLKGNEFVVKTIVTTETIKAIAENQNIKMYDCYTGFKWIAAVIRDLEGVERYIGGGEESYGFLAEDFCRDKDSVSAISLMAEICAWAKDRGLDFNRMLQEIYFKNGYSHEQGVSVVRPGKSGAEEIQAMMKGFRANPPKTIGGASVAVIKDYADLNCTDTATGKITKMDFPTTSNVLQFITTDGTKISIRPSGTEPKIKFYIEVHDKMKDMDDYDRCNRDAAAKIEVIKKDLGI